MIDAAIGCETFRFGYLPGLCSRGDQHLTAGGANPPHGLPVVRGSAAATRALDAVLRVEIGLLDFDVLPIDIQFFGDEHREHGLDALTDFRIPREQGDRPVGRDANKRIRLKWRVRWRLLGGELRLDVRAD